MAAVSHSPDFPADSEQARKNWADFGQVAPGVSNGQSEVRIDKLEFHRPRSVASQYGPDEGWTGLIQAVIFEVNDRDKIGYSAPDGYRYCCTKELVPKTKCHLNRLIYKVEALQHLLGLKMHHCKYTDLVHVKIRSIQFELELHSMSLPSSGHDLICSLTTRLA